MKKLALILLCITTMLACKKNNKDNTEITKTQTSVKTTKEGINWKKNVDGATFEQVKALAKKENKKIFIDFYTKWCGPCRAMDKQVFSKKEIGDFYNQKFINFKVDAEVGEGIELAKHYKVMSYPTYVFTDTNGNPLIGADGSIGRSDIDGMLEFAGEALGNKVKSWEEYQTEYATSDKKDPVFLQKYIKAQLKYQSRPPSDTLLLEWITALPQDTVFKNEKAKNTIFWKAIPVPNNMFYTLLINNKEKYPQLKEKEAAIQFLNSKMMMPLLNLKLDFKLMTKTLKADFPKYYDAALTYHNIDKMRFYPETKDAFFNSYFEFIDKEKLSIKLAGGAIEVNDTPDLKPEYALRAIELFEEGERLNPPHFYSIANKAYLLVKGNKMDEAQDYAKKFKSLTDTFESNKKMQWAYDTMRAIEARKMPEMIVW